MGLPVIPFVVGVAVGSVSTYLVKDKAARDKVLLGMQGFISSIATPLKPAEKPAQQTAEGEQSVVEAKVEAEKSIEEASERVAEAAKDVAESAEAAKTAPENG